jgi:hypothetical protein
MTQTPRFVVPSVATRQRALLVGLAVAGFLVAQQLVQVMTSLVAYGLNSDPGRQFLYQVVIFTFTTAIPFAAGVFVVFAFLAPILAELALKRVLLRSIIAGAAGAVLVAIVGTFVAIVIALANGSFANGALLFGNTFPTRSYADSIAGSFLGGIQGGINIFVSTLPLVVLAGVLFWLWLRRPAATSTSTD